MTSSLPFIVKLTFSSQKKLTYIELVAGKGEDSDTHYSSLIRACLTQKPSKELLAALDRGAFTPFQALVYEALLTVKPGETISYAGLADKIGKPKAARAVGNALGRNPFLIVIPCHRVIRENGELGGFAAGLDVKTKLLALEKMG